MAIINDMGSIFADNESQSVVNNTETLGELCCRWQASRIILFTAMAISCLVGIVFNSLNVIIFARLRYTDDHVRRVFYVALSLIDLAMGLTVILSFPAWVMGSWPYGEIFCDVTGFVMGVLPLLSIITVLMINTDCFMKITYALRYESLATERRAVKAVVTAFFAIVSTVLTKTLLIPDGFSKIMYYDEMGFCYVGLGDSTAFPSALVLQILLVWTPTLVITIIHIKLGCVARRHARHIAAQQKATDRSVSHHTATMKKQLEGSDNHGNQLPAVPHARRVGQRLVTPILITLACYCSWLPGTIMAVYLSRAGPGADLPGEVILLQSNIFIASGWWNTIIYLRKMPAYRKEAVKVIKCLSRAE